MPKAHGPSWPNWLTEKLTLGGNTNGLENNGATRKHKEGIDLNRLATLGSGKIKRPWYEVEISEEVTISNMMEKPK